MKGARQTPAPPWLHDLDHTADEGIEVTAPDAKTLFERCAWGLFSILTDMDAVRPVEAEDVVVEAPDREALLVRWLSELNVRHQVRHRVYGRFEVTELTDTRLAGRAWGEPLDPRRHALHAEVKAVTYHLLRVTEAAGGWSARVLFDV